MQIAEELSVLLGQPLNPSRSNQSVRCPMHDDKVASLSISIPKGAWYCWGCDKGGGLQRLAQFLGGELDSTDIIISGALDSLEPEEDKPNFFSKYKAFSQISLNHPAWRKYADAKELSDRVAVDFDIRLDGNTLVMPYYDGDAVVALRYLSYDGRKWYEPGSQRTIYNLNKVRGASKVILCEGESDTHSMYTSLADQRVADWVVGGIAGANNSVEKWELYALDMMWADRILIAFDNDDAGNKGADRALQVLGDRAERFAPPELYNDWNDAIMAGEIPKLEAR